MPTTLYIDGAWTTALDGGTRDIHCPANGEFVATVDEASEADTVAAIEADTASVGAGGRASRFAAAPTWPGSHVASSSGVLVSNSGTQSMCQLAPAAAATSSRLRVRETAGLPGAVATVNSPRSSQSPALPPWC